MRSKRKLFELLLENIDILETGLCWMSFQMLQKGILNYNEDELIIKTIHKKMIDIGLKKKDFLFPEGEKQPRIEWLKEQIKLSENEQL